MAGTPRRSPSSSVLQLGVLLVLTVVAGTSAFAGGFSRAGERPSRTLRRGIFDDLQKSLSDSAVQAASGLSPEESEALIEKCKSGKMGMEDYITVQRMFGKLGDMGNAVAPLANMLKNQAGSADDIEKAKEGLAEKEALVALMTDEEKANPDIFFSSGNAGRQAIRRWAERAKKTDQEILDFMLEYRTVRTMFGKLSGGADFADVQRDLKRESEELRSTLKSRKVRRSSKNKASKGGKQPEWMTL
mmetsp:Transcript_51116/g.95756  ORF Transcript_51116/g.95756 Transcript_51116/m.95756 type:complete len:245 (-) Transcript_51116:203-937(-)